MFLRIKECTRALVLKKDLFKPVVNNSLQKLSSNNDPSNFYFAKTFVFFLSEKVLMRTYFLKLFVNCL